MTTKITIIDNLHPEDMAMLQALQSRSPASVEERLKKVREVGSGAFVQKYLVGYGHKSIGDCGNTTIFIEGVTMLAAKAIQDWPLYSGQEASTRYMDFSEAEFANPLGTQAGEDIQENWRRFYLSTQEQVRAHLREKYPRQAVCSVCKGSGAVDDDSSLPDCCMPCGACGGSGEGEREAAWEGAIKARSFDILRSFLPAGATTNLSWSTNLRQAQDHLEWLRVHPDPSIRTLAIAIHAYLEKKYPNSFRLAMSDEHHDFRDEVMCDHYFIDGWSRTARSRLSPEHILNADFKENDLSRRRLEILQRRPKGQEIPWFFAEMGMISSDFLLDFGSFRDLQRHRNGVVRMPLLVTDCGFHPWYLNELPSPLRESAERVLELQAEAIYKLDCDDVTRQNYIAMGYRAVCSVTQSLPALVYRLELRSSKSVHPTLRQVVHKEIERFQQLFPNIPLHVDMDPDSWTVRRGTQTITEKA